MKKTNLVIPAARLAFGLRDWIDLPSQKLELSVNIVSRLFYEIRISFLVAYI